MEIDKATRHTERHTQARKGETRKNESQFFVTSWLAPASLAEERRLVPLPREGGEGRETNQPPLVRAHPFSAHPWLPDTLEPPSIGLVPRRDHLHDKLYRATPRQGSKYRIYTPPARHLQGLELFSDFHISISTPSAQVWNPRSFVPN